jgi:hypothetical protein
MSKIKLDANASGTGVFTIASPNSDTDRTLTLPEKAGTVQVGEGIDDNATSTAITIDSSERVGINSSSLSYRFEVAGAGEGVLGHIKATDSTQAYMMFSNSTTGSTKFAQGIIAGLDSDESAVFFNFESTPMRFGTGGAERMRIDSSGNLLVGTTSQLTNEMLGINQPTFGQVAVNARAVTDVYRAETTRTSGTVYFHYFIYNGSAVGSITSTGGGTSYNPSSDARLKENIRGYDNALSDVMKLKPRKFSWISNGEEDSGFIAQELLEVPEFSNRVNPITRDDDPLYGVDYMKFVAVLTGAIQEQQAIIEDLQTRLSALEAD